MQIGCQKTNGKPPKFEALAGWMFLWWITKQRVAHRARVCLMVGGLDGADS